MFCLCVPVFIYCILSQCAQRMYVLRLLQHQGLPPDKLHIITYSLIVSRIYYALPACGGFLSADLTCKINALFLRLVRLGYLCNNLTVSDLLGKADTYMFRNMCKSHHCLHHLLPPVRVRTT